jgi:hypothetical protein
MLEKAPGNVPGAFLRYGTPAFPLFSRHSHSKRNRKPNYQQRIDCIQKEGSELSHSFIKVFFWATP